MEEVWKDMSMYSTPAALQYHHLRLQQPSTPPPPTALTLSSTLEFTYIGSGTGTGTGTGPPSNSSSGDDSLMPDPFAAAAAGPTDIFSFAAAASGDNCSNKRHGQRPAGGNRRQRRMIKNRESIGGPVARAEAGLHQRAGAGLELAQLRRENEMLIKREEELNVPLRPTPDRPPTLSLYRSNCCCRCFH